MPPKGRVVVQELYCKGCELCVAACPQNVLGLSQERLNIRGYHPAELIAPGCTGCGICGIVCPEAAITVYREVLQPTPVSAQEG
ncbi:MAG: 4Fe-4S dicluster domain-containing protein [Chloroflexi bacterium]|nr:4Fe-4S dicluster domain-containing protein [Chloroflexota bacterium]